MVNLEVRFHFLCLEEVFGSMKPTRFSQIQRDSK